MKVAVFTNICGFFDQYLDIYGIPRGRADRGNTGKKKTPRKGRILVEVAGFEPTTFWSRTKRATKLRYTSSGANEGTRTLDLRFTKPLLYRLSHIGMNKQER